MNAFRTNMKPVATKYHITVPGSQQFPAIADLHVVVIWLQLLEFRSFFLHLNFEVPVGFK